MGQYLPQEVTELLDTNVTEAYDTFDPYKTYIFEDDEDNLTSDSMCLYNNYYWRSSSDDNLGNYPEDSSGNIDTNWSKYSESNLYSILDESTLSTSSSADGEDLWFIIEKTYKIQTIAIGQFTASKILIEYLDDGYNLLDTETYDYVSFPDVVDDWTYDYSEKKEASEASVKYDLQTQGDKLRIFFVKSSETNNATISFFTAGTPVELGATLADIEVEKDQYIPNDDEDAVYSQDTVTFTTKIDKEFKKDVERTASTLVTKVGTYIIDPSDTSVIENEIVLGTLTGFTSSLTDMDKVKFEWTVLESRSNN